MPPEPGWGLEHGASAQPGKLGGKRKVFGEGVTGALAETPSPHHEHSSGLPRLEWDMKEKEKVGQDQGNKVFTLRHPAPSLSHLQVHSAPSPLPGEGRGWGGTASVRATAGAQSIPDPCANMVVLTLLGPSWVESGGRRWWESSWSREVWRSQAGSRSS